MDTKKLDISDLEDIIHRFAVMRDRAAEVVELAQEVSDTLDDIRRTEEYLEEAKEENDLEYAQKCAKEIEEAKKDLEEFQTKLDDQFYMVRLDFYVNEVEDLL
jgi:DNA repair exonuclease SbcCD ATPase subunit